MDYAFWADAVGVLHALVVLFVIGGQGLILAGWRFGWGWARHGGFRRLHAATIAVVVAIAAFGAWCPLTLWEAELRRRAGEAGLAKGFIATWLEKLLYYDAPLWAFAIAYALFAALVAWTYWKYPPTN